MKNLRKILVIILVLGVAVATLVGCMPKNANTEPYAPFVADEGLAGENLSGAMSNPKNEEGESERKYNVTFMTNGGTSVAAMEVSVISTLPVTTRGGYIFNGWYTTSNFSDKKVEFPLVLTSDLTLYVKWLTTDTIIIRTPGDFYAMNDGLGGNYVLENDIVLPDGFSPIGWTKNDKGEYLSQIFYGTFDGCGYTIRGLDLRPIITEDEDGNEVLNGPVQADTKQFLPVNLGVFGRVGAVGARSGAIRNVRVEDFYIELRGDMSRFNAGGLVGYLEEGSVTNCSASGTFYNPLIEYEEGILDDFVGSYATPTSRCNIGGLIGKVGGLVEEQDPNDSTQTITILRTASVSNCYVTFNADSKSYAELLYIGGLAGYVEQGSEVIRSYATDIVISGGKYSGGFIGFNNGNVSNCYALATVETNLRYPTVAGGFVALNYEYSNINIAYASGSVTSKLAGGFVGVNDQRYSDSTGAVIRNAYSTCTVYGSEYAGGFVGRTKYGRIEYCMAFGNVTADNVELSYDPNDASMVLRKYTSHNPTYAGGFSAESFESTFVSCLAFGKSIVGASVNPSGLNNITYASNGVGQSSNLVAGIVGLEVQSVTRNGLSYNNDGTGYNSSPKISYATAANITYLTNPANHLTSPGLGYSTTIWNLNNLDFANDVRPTLRNILG